MQLFLYLMMTNAMLIIECAPVKSNHKYMENETGICTNESNLMKNYEESYINIYQNAKSRRFYNRTKRKSQRISKRNNRLQYPLQVHMFLNPFPTFGRQYPIYVTMPELGNLPFILNITVDTSDYLIDVKVTDPKDIPNGWQYTQKLDYLLRKNGIRVKSIPYRNCYFYRTYAIYYNLRTRMVIIKLSSLKHEDQLWAPIYQVGIRVRLSRSINCEPKISLPFCKNPERPVEISPNSYAVFMAEVRSNCMDINYDFIDWNIYDISDKYLVGHVAKTKSSILKFVPYNFHFIHGPKISHGFVLRATIRVYDYVVIARCYIRYLTPPVEPIILGNTFRLVNVENPIILSGALSRDRSKPKSHGLEGQLEWSCSSTDDPKNAYCRNEMSNKLKLNIPAGRLKSGSQYTYKLTMYSSLVRNVSGSTHQLVKGVSQNTFTPHIHCRRNCEMGIFAPLESTNVKAICYDCFDFLPRIEWWVAKGKEAPVLLSKANHLVVNNDVDKYTIKLKMFNPNGLTIETEKTLKRNDGPKNGTCEISPKMGVESVTIFTIDCKGFQSDYPPLLFRYMVKIGVVDTNVPYERYKLALPATDILYISICDASDMCVANNLEIDVRPLNLPPLRPIYGKRKLWPNRRLRGLLVNVPDMLSHGQWNRAFIRALASLKHMKRPHDGLLIYSYLENEEIIAGVQLEQLTVLAINMLSYITPVKYQGAALMANIFIKLSTVFKTTIEDREWLHRDIYNSLTAMNVFILTVLGTESEKLPPAMCQIKGEQCALARIMGRESRLVLDPLSLLRVNYWLKCTWFLYKCIYYLGVLASRRHLPNDDIFSVRKGGITYQINVTDINENVDNIAITTVDRMQIILLSKELLMELKDILLHDTVVFQIISQRSYHNIYWWYPEALPSETHVLIIHAYSPEKYLPSGIGIFVNNPLVFSMNITEFNENPEFRNWMINGSIKSDSHIHYYKLALYARSMLAVRIVSCTDDMRISLSLHSKPKVQQLRKTACHITPAMAGKRVWMSNYCPVEALAFVSVLSNTKSKNLRPRKKNKAREEEKKKLHSEQSKAKLHLRDSPLNYTILLETYECSYWKNSSLDPGWSTEFCRTDFAHSFGTSVKCTCILFGPLSSRIFPIAAERHIEVIVHPILEINWYMLGIFLILFLTLIAVLSTHMRGIAAHQRQTMVQCNTRNEVVLIEGLQFQFKPELLIMIVTGGQTFAGTTSNVTIYMKSLGLEQVTYHIQQDPMRPRLLRNSIVRLLVSRGSVNLPTRLALGIERAGRYPKWFCRSVTIVDLEHNIEQFFPIDRWIRRGHTRFIRSPYYTSARRHRPPFTWFQRFWQKFEELAINWHIGNPIIGPWLTSIAPYAMNRFERSCVFICKLSITIALVSIWFGPTTTQTIQEHYNRHKDGISIHLVVVLGFWIYVLCLSVHLLFEFIIMRWLVRRK